MLSVNRLSLALEFPEGKVKNLKIPGGFSKGISSTPRPLVFFWNSQISKARLPHTILQNFQE